MILVTGGAGFIGANFIHQWLTACDEPVVNLDKLTYAGNEESLRVFRADRRHVLIRADIGDRSAVAGLLDAYRPWAVINFAAESHVDRSIHGPDDFMHTNVMGTFHLLEAVRAYWMQLDGTSSKAFRFFNVSTDEVYGSASDDSSPFNEDMQYRPNSPYSASKAASDHLVRAWHRTYGLPVLSTNCSNNYGPYQFPEKLIPLCLLNALAGKPLPIYGDGMQIRDWLYVQDHCRAIRCVLQRGQVGETYNVGGWNEMANLDVVRAICDVLDRMRPRPDGNSYRAQIRRVADRPGHDRRYAIDAGKIRGELDWRPLESFESGLGKTIEWYLSNSSWVKNVTTGEYRKWMTQQYGT